MRKWQILFVLILCSACRSESNITNPYEFTVLETTVSSRTVQVPVTFVQPVAKQSEMFPLVVMIHGHGGTRHEAGGFTRVAEGLAVKGVASIRMDFPGCGDSTEAFSNNNLTNMLKDVQASHQFALSKGKIDPDRVGLFGFSMGGRVAMLLAAKDPSFKAIATWAPDAVDGAHNMVDFVGGLETYDELRAQAKIEGFAPFTTRWGQNQQLGYQWFLDLEETKPLDAIKAFRGALFVLYGDLDDVVLPVVSEELIRNASNSSEIVKHVVVGADHGLGLFNDDFARSEEAVSKTVSFLSQTL